MSEYGLAGRRDNEGNRKPVEHEFEWKGQPVTIKLLPPTVSEAEEYEDLGEEVGAGEMADIVGNHIVKPEFEDASDMTVEELQAYVMGIMDYASDGDDLQDRVDAELEKRDDGSAGN